jgi:hypothetical protein
MTIQASRQRHSPKQCKRTYDNKIDNAIYNYLSRSESLGSTEMKSKLEGSLGRKISYDTYSAHIKTMVKEKDLLKHDTGERGKKSVYYSLSKGAKQRRDLRILRVHPERESLEKIYANLFVRSILDGISYCDTDLDNILREIHASRDDLIIDRSETVKIKYCDTISLMNNARRVPVNLMSYYKPTACGVEIVEITGYRENILYGNRKEEEFILYNYTVPGISIDEFANTFYAFKPDMPSCQLAFRLLLDRRLIRPIMEFRGKTRYAITDSSLRDFLLDLQILHKLKMRFSYLQWSCLRGPTTDETQIIKMHYSDEKSCERSFNKDELDRYEFKRNLPGDKFLQVKRQAERYMNLAKELFTSLTNHIKIRNDYYEMINKYPFLENIIRLSYHTLLEEDQAAS